MRGLTGGFISSKYRSQYSFPCSLAKSYADRRQSKKGSGDVALVEHTPKKLGLMRPRWQTFLWPYLYHFSEN